MKDDSICVSPQFIKTSFHSSRPFSFHLIRAELCGRNSQQRDDPRKICFPRFHWMLLSWSSIPLCLGRFSCNYGLPRRSKNPLDVLRTTADPLTEEPPEWPESWTPSLPECQTNDQEVLRGVRHCVGLCLACCTPEAQGSITTRMKTNHHPRRGEKTGAAETPGFPHLPI